MIRRPPRSTQGVSSAASDVYKRQATTMCVSGEQTPRYVKCFVEDCGYTSVWDEFSNEISARFSLPDFPLMYTASWVVKAKYGWGFNEASPLKQVAKCQKPMLFIHGDNDTFVPTWMVYPLYEAKPQPKALWIAPVSYTHLTLPTILLV